MKSIWTENVEIPKFKSLSRDMKVDNLIIGGGMAGILCAYMLHQAGVDYVLVEAKEIGSGITKNTTAKITSQHGLIYSRLVKEFNVEMARLYYESNENALKEYRRICSHIDCDFEERNSYVYALTEENDLEKEMTALEKILDSEKRKGIRRIDHVPLPFSTFGAITFAKQAQFHPLKFVSAIAKDLNIYENTKIMQIKKEKAQESYIAEADGVRIFAKNVVVATHFPFINKHGSYFMKQYQSRSYVIGIEKTKESPSDMYVEARDKGISFRDYKDLLILGGGAYRTGKKDSGWKELEDFQKIYYQNASLKYHWATQDCMTLDGIPYIGQYSARTKGFYTMTGFNKWGMTSAMAAAMLIRDLIMENANPYEKLYSPSRTMFRKQLFLNGLESTMNLFTFSRKRCPHLGCALKWNSQEHSWDCACHGSRFSEDGELIDNPATDDLN